MNMVEAIPESLLKKHALTYAYDGVLYTRTCKRKYFRKSSPYVSPMPAPLELPEATLQQINEAEINHSNTDSILSKTDIPKNHIDYALQCKQSLESMHWKACYETGKKDGYFSAYASPATLKRAFYKKDRHSEED